MTKCDECDHDCRDRCDTCCLPQHTVKNTIKEIYDLWGITVPFMPQDEWGIIRMLNEEALGINDIAKRCKTEKKSDMVWRCIRGLEYRQFVESANDKYSLTQKGAKLLTFGPPGSVAQLAAEHCIGWGHCVQGAGKRGLLTYGYGDIEPPTLVCIFPDDPSDDDLDRMRVYALEAYGIGILDVRLWSRDDEQIRKMIRGLPTIVQESMVIGHTT